MDKIKDLLHIISYTNSLLKNVGCDRKYEVPEYPQVGECYEVNGTIALLQSERSDGFIAMTVGDKTVAFDVLIPPFVVFPTQEHASRSEVYSNLRSYYNFSGRGRLECGVKADKDSFWYVFDRVKEMMDIYNDNQ